MPDLKILSNHSEERLPALQSPPIVEVVCGVVFDPVPDLGPLVLGLYSNERRKDFPQQALHPAITDDATFMLGGVPPLRVFLTSIDEQFFLQLQHDRFFINWRTVGTIYPRFSGHGGLLEKMEEEFERFCLFLERSGRPRPEPRRIELTKIDVLHRDTHWADGAELAAMLPITAALTPADTCLEREVNLRFVDHEALGDVFVHVATHVSPMRKPVAVRIETRRVAKVEGVDLAEGFRRSNDALNEVFFKLMPRAAELFGRKEGK